MKETKEFNEEKLENVSGGYDNPGVPEFKQGDKVIDAEKIIYTIQSFDGVYVGENNYSVIIDFIPANVLPLTSCRVGDIYHISESRLRYYHG